MELGLKDLFPNSPMGGVWLQVQTIVNEFKASTLTIGWRAQEISETLLVRISGKRVYRDLEFEEDQREHRAAIQQKLMSLHQDVVAIMTNSYEVFKNDGPEVRLLWPGLCGWADPQPPQPHQNLLLVIPLPPHPDSVYASQTSHSSLGFTQPSAFQPLPSGLGICLSIKTTHFPPCWLVLISQDLPCFPWGILFPTLPTDSAAVDAVHDSVGPHDGGCLEAEREVVSVGTVQGHQWGWQDHPQPTLPSACHFEEWSSGRCGPGGSEPLCLEHPETITLCQFLLILRLGPRHWFYPTASRPGSEVSSLPSPELTSSTASAEPSPWCSHRWSSHLLCRPWQVWSMTLATTSSPPSLSSATSLKFSSSASFSVSPSTPSWVSRHPVQGYQKPRTRWGPSLAV